MHLSPEDHERIDRAIAAAEAATRGKIVFAVTEEAAPYIEVPLGWATTAALLGPLFVLAIVGVSHGVGLSAWVAPFAHARSYVVPVVGGLLFAQYVVFAAVFAAVSLPAVRRRLTPGSITRAHVRDRALEQFFGHGLHKAAEEASVLIFVSLGDRQVEVLAGAGLSDRVDADAWRSAVAEFTEAARAGRPADGVVRAIERSASLLAMHFPRTPAPSSGGVSESR